MTAAQREICRFASCAVVSLCLLPPLVFAQGDIVTFTSVKDSTLRGGSKNRNEGANPAMRLQSSGSNRAIMAFDLGGVSLVGLLKATVVLTIDDADPPASWGSGGRNIEAHRLLSDFAEGNGKQFGVPNSEKTRGTGAGVTWHCASDAAIENQAMDCQTNWQNGDTAIAPATAPLVLITNGMTGEVSFDVTQDVLDGAGYGWIVKKEFEGQNGNIHFSSREGVAPPKLVLEYTDTTPPTLSIDQPSQGTVYNVMSIAALVSYADQAPGSGIDPASFTATLDGQDVTNLFTAGATQATGTLSSLAMGQHTLAVSIDDGDGNQATGSSTLSVNLLRVDHAGE